MSRGFSKASVLDRCLCCDLTGDQRRRVVGRRGAAAYHVQQAGVSARLKDLDHTARIPEKCLRQTRSSFYWHFGGTASANPVHGRLQAGHISAATLRVHLSCSTVGIPRGSKLWMISTQVLCKTVKICYRSFRDVHAVESHAVVSSTYRRDRCQARACPSRTNPFERQLETIEP